MSDIQDISSRLGSSYSSWKESEKEKDKVKKEFFAAITAAMPTKDLADRIVEIEELDFETAREIVRKRYPRWYVNNSRPLPQKNGWEFLLVEDPQYASYQYVNKDDGMVYSRQVQAGATMLDDEKLKEDDPDFWNEITHIPEPERQLKSMDQLTAEQLAKLSEYMYEGKPVTKLPAPRKAKPEELE